MYNTHYIISVCMLEHSPIYKINAKYVNEIILEVKNELQKRI